jgi:plasmid stabilization system protein ParE
LKIFWTRLALQDLDQAWNYIASDKPEAADGVLEMIGKSVESLLSYQNLGRPGRVKGTRELVVVGTPFVVPYCVKKNRIEILAVIHGSRRWPESL